VKKTELFDYLMGAVLGGLSVLALALAGLVIVGCPQLDLTSAVGQDLVTRCDEPFPTQCWPGDPEVVCDAVCAPNPGYCPDYGVWDYNRCLSNEQGDVCWSTPNFVPRAGCSQACRPTFPKWCMTGDLP
jgi:hypothetical protein